MGEKGQPNVHGQKHNAHGQKEDAKGQKSGTNGQNEENMRWPHVCVRGELF